MSGDFGKNKLDEVIPEQDGEPHIAEEEDAENKKSSIRLYTGMSSLPLGEDLSGKSQSSDQGNDSMKKEPNTKNNSESLKVMNKISAEVFDWLEVIATAIVIVVVIFTFFFRVATIDGNSMLNTLHDGEKVIISNLFYQPKRGDIIVISRNKNNSIADEPISELPIIKRVIAVEGQTVDIDFTKGVVYVDGEELDEPYVNAPTLTKYEVDFPVTVKKDCIFVMGDNRNESLDSRSYRIGDKGMIDTKYVLGHAIIRIFPFNKIGGLFSS